MKIFFRTTTIVAALAVSTTIAKAQTYVSPEIEPYIEFIENCDTSPVDYIMGLFEKYDVVVLGERDHRDTTQYNLIRDIMADPRFIENVGNVLTEVGMYNMRDELNGVLKADYQTEADFDRALAGVNMNLHSIPWEKSNYLQLQHDIHEINNGLPAEKKISMYPTDVQYSWEEAQNVMPEEFKRFFNVMRNRDLIMGNNACDALYLIFKQSRKKALVIYNGWAHALRYYENGHDDSHLAFQVIADRFPGRVANVALNWAADGGYNQPYAGLTNGGKWDAAFAACGNKPIGFDLDGTVFGDDPYDLFVEYTAEHPYKDVYHGFIFYKPTSEWVSGRGIPIFTTLDKTYVKNELAKRFTILQGEMPEEMKEEIYQYMTKPMNFNIFNPVGWGGNSLQKIEEEIAKYYKP